MVQDLAGAARPGVMPIMVAPGCYNLRGLDIEVVTGPGQVLPALQRLRESMMGDHFIAIDLEWRPDFYRGSNNNVALIQLASSTKCLLIRTCQVGFPTELCQFLSDPAITFVGLEWGTNDAAKMASSFGWHTTDFGRFEDLSLLARPLGFERTGLAYLAEVILGIILPKSKKVTLSNWAAPMLSPEQIRYAALDAALTFALYKRLRYY